MKSKNVVFVMLLVLTIFAIIVVRFRHEPKKREPFDRHPSTLQFTSKALCEMNCLHVSKDEIFQVLEKGIVNLNESDLYKAPCPLIAVQGTTDANHDLRLFIEPCKTGTIVLSCMDLKNRTICTCTN
jgi:hypothetical protein